MQRRSFVSLLAGAVLAPSLVLSSAYAADKYPASLDKATIEKASASIDKGIAFYRKNQNDDGSFSSGRYQLAITSLAVAGMLDTGRIKPTDEMISKAMKYLEGKVQKDGGIYDARSFIPNYTTAIGLMAFNRANNDDGNYKTTIDNAVKYLKGVQIDKGKDDINSGGVGYGSRGGADLSNTTFMLEALKDSGVDEKDPAFQRAMLFVKRCQNFSGEGGNDLPYAKKSNDGGFIYKPKPGEVGETTRGLRSYGSMTYAGLKSFVYAGMKKDDPPVKAALGWIKKNYTLEENPGIGQEGLFYYFHTFSKALSALEVEKFVDAEDKEHNWRKELIDTLVKKQNDDGSWKNPNPKWAEGEPLLTTGFVLLSLGHTLEVPAKK